MTPEEYDHYYGVTVSEARKADLERAAAMVEALGPEVWEALDTDLDARCLASMLREFKTHRPDDDAADVFGVMGDLWKMGHKRIPRLVMPAGGWNLAGCEADWQRDLEPATCMVCGVDTTIENTGRREGGRICWDCVRVEEDAERAKVTEPCAVCGGLVHIHIEAERHLNDNFEWVCPSCWEGESLSTTEA